MTKPLNMHTTPVKEKWASRRKNVQPKAINVSQENLIKASFLAPGQTLPLVVEPTLKEVDLMGWARNNRKWIETNLLEYGGILFRGFGLNRLSYSCDPTPSTACRRGPNRVRDSRCRCSPRLTD